MTLMETAQLLGNFGEFAGAIAVVVTLLYLAIQVRPSTAALIANSTQLEDSRKLAIAQAYDARAYQSMQGWRELAESEHQARIMNEVFVDGEIDSGKLAELAPLDRQRLIYWQMSLTTYVDNLHYQYQQGFLDPEFYERVVTAMIQSDAPNWRKLGMSCALILDRAIVMARSVAGEAGR